MMLSYADLTFIWVLPIFQRRIWQGWGGELLGIVAAVFSTFIYFVVLHYGLADCEEFTSKYPATVHAVSTFLAQTVVPFLVRLSVFGFEECIAYTERRRGVGTGGTGGTVPAQEGQEGQNSPRNRDEPNVESPLLNPDPRSGIKSKTKTFGSCAVIIGN